MTVWVVLEHCGQATRLVGVYASEEVAGRATGAGGQWALEVFEADVLTDS